MSQIQGLEIGLVTKVDDPEHLGRIKLNCPRLGAKHETDWVRIAGFLSGPNQGSYFIPDVGDEAVLGYLRGDAACPYVLGFVSNRQDRPADTDPHKRTIKSKSGHTIILDDTPGSQQITIQSEGNQVIKLDNRSIELTGGGRKITMAGGQVQIT